MQHYALVTESHIRIVCYIIDLRIKKNFSAALLSYIIGRPGNYVEQLEAFQQRCYPVAEVKKIAKILGGKDVSSWMRAQGTDEMISICMKKTKGKGYFTYSCKTFNGKKRKTFLHLQEPADIRRNIFTEDFSDLDVSIGMDMLEVLVRDGYLDKARLPIDVYAEMNKFLQFEVDPGYVLFLLEMHTADFHPQKLKTLKIAGCQNYVRDHRYR